MAATVKIKPEVLTEHRMRMEMRNLEDEDIENTIRMKGWAWVLARKSWVYAGEPDFIYRQIREVVIALPDIIFDEASIGEGVETVREAGGADVPRLDADAEALGAAVQHGQGLGMHEVRDHEGAALAAGAGRRQGVHRQGHGLGGGGALV